MRVFNLGTKVIALHNTLDGGQVMEKGKQYKVHAFAHCKGCGKQYINLGLISEYDNYKSCQCSEIKYRVCSLNWTPSIFFETKVNILRSIQEAVRFEDYERAANLNGILKRTGN